MMPTRETERKLLQDIKSLLEDQRLIHLAAYSLSQSLFGWFDAQAVTADVPAGSTLYILWKIKDGHVVFMYEGLHAVSRYNVFEVTFMPDGYSNKKIGYVITEEIARRGWRFQPPVTAGRKAEWWIKNTGDTTERVSLSLSYIRMLKSVYEPYATLFAKVLGQPVPDWVKRL